MTAKWGRQMKNQLMAAAAVIATVSGASAQSYGGQWQGYYAGGSLNWADDSDDLAVGGAFAFSLDYAGSGLGAFAGYNMQNGNVVFGAEVAYSPFTADDPAGAHSGTRKGYFDLKGRLGYTFGQALVYGLVGYSHATTIESPGNVDIDTDGMNIGLGLDYRVGERAFVGVEIIQRSMDGDYTASGFPGWTFDSRSQAVSVRAGFSF